MHLFCTSAFVFLPAGGLFSFSRPRRTQGARGVHTAYVWDLAKLRDTRVLGVQSRINLAE